MLGVLVTLFVVPPAVAADHHPAKPHVKPGAIKGRITFTKNRADPFSSTLTFQAWQRVVPADGTPATWQLLEQQSWRAGSGLGGRRGTNACAKNVGWLPNGTYSARQENDHHGNLIKGRTFDLSAKKCRTGTLRHLLYIHTETGARNRQCPNRPGDQHCRWEYPQINDYRSNGCIKMSPDDLAALTAAYHRYFKAGRSYPRRTFALRVTG